MVTGWPVPLAGRRRVIWACGSAGSGEGRARDGSGDSAGEADRPEVASRRETGLDGLPARSRSGPATPAGELARDDEPGLARPAPAFSRSGTATPEPARTPARP